MSRLTAAEVAQAQRLRAEGRSVTQIQRLIGRPPHLIRQALNTAPIPRRPHGAILWNEAFCQRLVLRLRQGQSMAEIARQLGVTSHALNQGAIRHGLNIAPHGEVFVSTLRREAGVTEKVVYARAAQLGISPRLWGQQRTVTDREASLILDTWAGSITVQRVQQEGWVSSREAARRLGITWRMFMIRARVHPLRRARVLGLPGQPYRYHPDDVARLPVPVAPKGKPRGFVTLAHLSDLTGVSTPALLSWMKRGCPHVRDRVAYHATYAQPAAVLRWLEDVYRPQSQRAARERAIEGLRQHLAGAEGRAA